MQRKAGITGLTLGLFLAGALALVVPTAVPTFAFADDKPGQFDTIRETADQSRGEVSRIRSVYRPTGLTAELTVDYADGSVEVTQYNFTSTGLKNSFRRYVRVSPSGRTYLERETLFDAKTGEWSKALRYRADGTLQFRDEPGPDKYSITRTIYDTDGKTVLRTLVLEQ